MKLRINILNFIGTLRIYLLLILLSLVFFPVRMAYSQEPNILGTYSGTATLDEFNCGTGAPGNPPLLTGGTETVNMTLIISSQSGSSFSGSGTQTFPDGDIGTIDFSGTVDTSGNVNGSFTTSDPDVTSAGTFSGSIISGVFTLTASGSDTSSIDNGFCDFEVTGSLNLVAGANADLIVDPSITPSSTLVNPLLINTQIQSLTSNVGTRIGDVLRGTALGLQRTTTGLMLQGQSGLSAGESATGGYGVWGSYSYSDFDNDLSSTAFDGDRHSGLLGVDFSPWENTLFGLAAGYEFSDVDTSFNAGNVETDGYTVIPYFGYLFTDTWSVDASIGYSSIEADQFRTSPTTNARITSSPDSNRWFGMLNLNGITTWNNWIIGGRIGSLWARNIQESFTESDGTFNAETRSKLGTWNISGDVAYSYGSWEPFARATYERDYSLTEIAVTTGPQPSNDRDDFLVGAGIRYFSANGITGNFEWSKRIGRNHFDEDTFTLTIRGEF